MWKGQSPSSRQHQEIPDSPEKFWTVGNPTYTLMDVSLSFKDDDDDDDDAGALHHY